MRSQRASTDPYMRRSVFCVLASLWLHLTNQDEVATVPNRDHADLRELAGHRQMSEIDLQEAVAENLLMRIYQ